MLDKNTQTILSDINSIFLGARNRTMSATMQDPACGAESREEIEDDSDTIEQVIIDNADLIQDYRFKYIQKKMAGKNVEVLLAEFGYKILDMIDRKLDDLA